MFKYMLLVAAVFVFSTAHPLEVAEDENGEQYVLIPLSREKRQTTYDISKTPRGTHVQLGHQGTVFNDGTNKFTAGGTVSKTFNPNSPTTYGGNLGYSHEPSGSGISIGAQKTPGFGTDVGVQGRYNIWREGKATLDAVGSYNRHYGGPYGAGSPNYYGGVELSVPFGK